MESWYPIDSDVKFSLNLGTRAKFPREGTLSTVHKLIEQRAGSDPSLPRLQITNITTSASSTVPDTAIN